MLKYVLKRILIFIPTILVISLLTFILISNAPGDPAETMLTRGSGEGQASDKLATESAYQQLRHRLGLDLPVFYFSFSNKATSDTLLRIPRKDHRENLSRLTYQYGNWERISDYYQHIKTLEVSILTVQKDSETITPLINLRNAVTKLYSSYNDGIVTNIFEEIKQNASTPAFASVLTNLSETQSIYQRMKTEQTVWKNYLPTIQWNGRANQYHRWLLGEAKWIGEEDKYKSRGFVRGDFGTSFFTKRPVSDMIWDGVQITMLISILAILIEYLISIPTGVFSAVNKNSRADQIISTSLFMLYSLPSFWIGTLMIFFLCGGDYFDFFPPAGLGDTTFDDGILTHLGDLAHHLILPLFCWTYASFAFLSRQMRGGMLTVLQQDYIRTARSKGLSQKQVIWKHAFRNSLLPIITMFASIFPAIISGSFVLEFLFTIPGMGKQTLEAVFRKDYPMILTTTMIAAVLTLIGYLIADILYAVVDPRISYSKKS